MGNFNRDEGPRGGHRGGFSGGRRSFGHGRGFGGHGNYSRDDRQMFSAVCSNCGKDCQVPFRPTGDRPVYCSDCFEKMGGRDEKRSFDRSGHDDRSSSDDKHKAQLESINVKLDKILNLLQPQNIDDASSPAETAVETVVEKKETKPAKLKKASKEKTITSEV